MNYNNEMFINQFRDILIKNKPAKILFVCSAEYDRFGYRHAIDGLETEIVPFCDFSVNPEVSDVKKGVFLFKEQKCDFIVTVGGGSAMDTAKAIKFFAESNVKILAVPTTAGTGAEVTRYAVLYNNGDKDSVRSYDIIPNYAVFDYKTLASLPRFQKIVTGLDAFSHAVEAYWSVHSTQQSREYSAQALDIFNGVFMKFIDGDESTYEDMMKCSELAGRAINIAQTTAPHALSYKIHKFKGFYHGHAVALCLLYIWKYMEENSSSDKLDTLLEETARVSHFTPESFKNLLISLGLHNDLTLTHDQFKEALEGVNIDRLSNHPMRFSLDDIEKIYCSFLDIV